MDVNHQRGMFHYGSSAANIIQGYVVDINCENISLAFKQVHTTAFDILYFEFDIFQIGFTITGKSPNPI